MSKTHNKANPNQNQRLDKDNKLRRLDIVFNIVYNVTKGGYPLRSRKRIENY